MYLKSSCVLHRFIRDTFSVYYLISDSKPRFHLKGPSINLITYAPRGDKVSYVFLLHITYKKGGRGARWRVKLCTYLMGGP